MKFKKSTIIFLLLLYLPAFSQDGTWTIFNTANSNLAENTITAIAVDGDYIWIGTQTKGLSRYQKSLDRWENFSTENSGIINDRILSLKTGFECLWIGTAKGLSCFAGKENQWTSIDSTYIINSIAIDNSAIWYGTANNGVFCYDIQNKETTQYLPSNSGLCGSKIVEVRIDGHLVWFMTDAGICSLNKVTREWQTLSQSKGTYTLEIDGDYLWTGAVSGAYRYNKLTREWTDFPVMETDTVGINITITYYPVRDIAVNEQYTVLGTSRKGIRRYDKQADMWENFSMSNSGIAGDQISALAFDGNDIWIGTWRKGLCRYSNPVELWRTYLRQNSGLVDNIVRGIAIDSANVWFSTYGKGACRYIKATRQWVQYTRSDSGLAQDYIWSLAADNEYVWFFCLGDFISRLHKASGKWDRFNTAETFKSGAVYTADADEQFTWFGCADGQVTRFERETGEWIHYDSLQTKLTSPIMSLKAGKDKIWFGSNSTGAASYDKNFQNWEQFDSQNSGLPGDYVMSIDVDGDSAWLGTTQGAVIYNQLNDSWTPVTCPDTSLGNLQTDPVTSIGIQHDFAWLGTLFGLYRLQKSTQTWEIFYSYNSPLITNQIRHIAVDEKYFWVSTYDTQKENGGVNRYADLRPPFVGHTALSSVPANAQPSRVPVTILAEINDEVAISQAELKYRHISANSFGTTYLTPEFRTIFKGFIPASAVEPGIVEYWISVSDGTNISTHPFSNARTQPHRFYVYDSVPPVISTSISSPSGFIVEDQKIQVNIEIDGTGSPPLLEAIRLVRYLDLNQEDLFDSLEIELEDSTGNQIENALSVAGHFTLSSLPASIQSILIEVAASDEGHDENNQKLMSRVFSNLLIRPVENLPVAQITEPDSFAIVGKIVTIVGSASSPTLKQFQINFQDLQGNQGMVTTGFENKTDGVLGLWDTSHLPDDTVSIKLIVENIEGQKNSHEIPVILDNTPPEIVIENITNNQLIGGQVAVIGTVQDAHFKEYQLDFGIGVNPLEWQPIGYARQNPVRQDTLIKWDTAELQGLYTLRLQAIDLVGNKSTYEIVIQADNYGGNLAFQSPAPNTVVSDTVLIYGTAHDENFAEYTLAFSTPADSTQWKTIHSSVQPVTNGLLAGWGTNNLQGTFILKLTLNDKIGHRNSISTILQVDNLPPVARIEKPASGEQVSDLIEVWGTAFDHHLQNYFLEWGQGQSPASWTPVSNLKFTTAVESDNLGQWSANGKTGEYSLRLTVKDECGHVSRDSVTFQIIAQMNSRQGHRLCSEDGVMCLYLPPNALHENSCVTINTLPVENSFKSNISIIGKIYRIAPENISVLKSATLCFYLNKLDNLPNESSASYSIAKFSGSDSSWHVIGGTKETEKIVTAINRFGDFTLTDQKIAGGENEISRIECRPRVFSPINDGETNIIFTMGAAADVTVKIYNLAGRLVRPIIAGEYLDSGRNVLHWNGRDSAELLCPNGLYLVVIKAGNQIQSKTVMILDK